MSAKRTKWAYIPFNQGAGILDDAIRLDGDGRRIGPAGRVLCSLDGSEPEESTAECLDGRYAERVSYREIVRSGLSREFIDFVRECQADDDFLRNVS